MRKFLKGDSRFDECAGFSLEAAAARHEEQQRRQRYRQQQAKGVEEGEEMEEREEDEDGLGVEFEDLDFSVMDMLAHKAHSSIQAGVPIQV